jgi:hypothetical protein
MVTIVSIFVGLVSCGNIGDAEFSSNRDNGYINHTSMRDAETGVTISLGMTKTEIERLLGAPIISEDGMYLHQNLMAIHYNNLGDAALGIGASNLISDIRFELYGFRVNTNISLMPLIFNRSLQG